ncbi:LuxR C-terminal-related transcriptional regulator [Deinococcus multiflagellatus]|uniref:LuxR C-terminal-related transcriptional regulator n=1 Tax=Deinococcus multiflagellatus TaxID=1656887 RepID=A0ABW1ZRN1_9DEIO|nr:LuxR C-terminal-related transcriptional regulator [Deinococcus multiflagellatus]MBZ9715019.1 LuxR C-terminal-related transcriptional regulator [Deinococcus multiflagellatus]
MSLPHLRPVSWPGPEEAPELVGREADEAALLAALRGGTRLLTLVGPGGVGKTALASAVARQAAQLGLAVHEADLSALTEGERLAEGAARALGVRLSGAQPPLQALRAFLPPRPRLLVLDNLEQMQGAAPAVAELLAALPEVQVLVTSRRALGLRRERVWRVQPLALPGPGSAAAALGSPAATLFLTRAREAVPGFALAPGDEPLLTDLVRRLDGLPLALELAARRTGLFSLRALLGQVQARLPEGGPADAPRRHRSLAEVARWSEQLLPDPVARLFRWLSVFPGPFGAEDAQALMAGAGPAPDTFADLLDLAESSLIVPLPDGRFRLLETLRAYAAERLDHTGERRAAVLALAALVLRDLDQRVAAGQEAALAPHLDAAHERAALVLVWVTAQPAPDPDAASWGARLCAEAYATWVQRGRGREGLAWCRQLLARTDLAPAARVRAGTAAGLLLARQGHMAEARALLGATRATAATLDPELHVRVLLAEGGRRLMAAEPGCLELAEAALALAGDAGLPALQASAQVLLARAALDAGQLARATALLEAALSSYRAGPQPYQEMLTAVTLGDVLKAGGEPERARAAYEESLHLAEVLGAEHGRAVAQSRLGLLWMNVFRDPGRARPLFQAALQAMRAQHDLTAQAILLYNLGDAEAVLNEDEAAERAYRAATALFGRLGWAGDIAQVQAILALVVARQGRLDEALNLARRAWPVLVEAGNWPPGLNVALALAAAGLALDQPQQAAAALAAGDALAQEHRLGDVWVDDADRLRLQAGVRARLAPDVLARASALPTDGAQHAITQALARAVQAPAEAGGHTGPALAAAPQPGPLGPGAQTPPTDLTPRELDVLRLLRGGHPNKRIASLLGLSETTVRNYLSAAYAKLGVRNRTQALSAVLALGLVKDGE